MASPEERLTWKGMAGLLFPDGVTAGTIAAVSKHGLRPLLDVGMA
jgi:hypothetical protein